MKVKAEDQGPSVSRHFDDIRDVMVHLDGTSEDEVRIAHGEAIAAVFDAHLTGIYTNPLPEVKRPKLARDQGWRGAGDAFTTGQMLPRYDDLMVRTVAEVMTEAVIHVEPEAPLTRVLQLMVHLKARSLPVIDRGRLAGMISREDIMRALAEATAAKP
jgi:CBS domain-containing protein